MLQPMPGYADEYEIGYARAAGCSTLTQPCPRFCSKPAARIAGYPRHGDSSLIEATGAVAAQASGAPGRLASSSRQASANSQRW
jgi:hypothetical protein